MMTILKRSTAIAALAAVPFVAHAAGDEATKQTKQMQGQSAQAQTSTEVQGQQAGSQDATVGQVEELIDEARDASGSQELESAPDEAEQHAEDLQERIQQQTPEAGQQTGQQQTGTTQQSAQQDDTTQQMGQQQAAQPETGQQQMDAQATMDDDVTVATVNDEPIRRSDVLEMIGMMPPQLQQQPAEALVPLAIDQLIMRQLILQEARESGLEEDADVTTRSGDGSPEAVDNAMVQTWLERELEGAVTEEGVQETYEEVRTQMGDQTPPLDQIRAEIEEEVRRRAFRGISEDLQQDAEIVFFGPDGEPLTTTE